MLSSYSVNSKTDSKSLYPAPFVTVQLPIYNEKYVIGRLIDCIADFDYPMDRFEIHILDDSTDDTVAIVAEKVAHYQSMGYNIRQIIRGDRVGFKAGALKDAMGEAKGDYIAIFDADFLPKRDFLLSTLDHFSNPQVGVVQTRWEHINQGYSLLTELQAFQLNVHFTIEQKGRYKAGYMLQFNGTAGVWRKSCIEDAGGWEADTLTEDLDLSYRAQLKGWEIVYREDVTAPAELPIEINGLKSQQFRWMKGGAETARKVLPKVWASEITLVKKIQATVHLISSSIFLFVFILGVFSVPIIFLLVPLGIDSSKFVVFLVSLLSIVIVYFVANVGVAWPRESKIKMVFKFLILFPVFLALSMGLAFHNSWAVLQGFFGKQSTFVRTPKYGITTERKFNVNKSYFSNKIDWITVGEGFLAIYFIMGLYLGWTMDVMDFFSLHVLLASGYLILFYYSIESKFLK